MKLMFTVYPIKRICPAGSIDLFELDKTKPSRHNFFDKNDPTAVLAKYLAIITIPFAGFAIWIVWLVISVLIK